MPGQRHPKKAVEDALRYAEQHGWQVETGGSHAWGKIYCPNNDKDCRCGEDGVIYGGGLDYHVDRRFDLKLALIKRSESLSTQLNVTYQF